MLNLIVNCNVIYITRFYHALPIRKKGSAENKDLEFKYDRMLKRTSRAVPKKGVPHQIPAGLKT